MTGQPHREMCKTWESVDCLHSARPRPHSTGKGPRVLPLHTAPRPTLRFNPPTLARSFGAGPKAAPQRSRVLRGTPAILKTKVFRTVLHAARLCHSQGELLLPTDYQQIQLHLECR